MSSGFLNDGVLTSLSISQTPSTHLPPSIANFYMCSPPLLPMFVCLITDCESSEFMIYIVQLPQFCASNEFLMSLTVSESRS